MGEWHENDTWPEPAQLKPADAMRLADEKTRASAEANKVAAEAKAAKDRAVAIAMAVLDEYELGSADTTLEDGRRMLYYTDVFRAYRVTDPEEFKLWAMAQGENYYDTTPRVREGILRDHCRQLVEEGQPLPPGVEEYTETRLYHKAK